MPEPPPPPNKPILKREGFKIKDGVITYSRHERMDGARLEALFHPERLHSERLRKKATEDAKKIFSRPFFASQLHHYGITFPKSTTEPQLKSLLEKAVAAKQCIYVPSHVTNLHQQLRLDYEKEVEVWQKTVQNWGEDFQRRQDEQWAQLETPSERAGYDLDRFMNHYFLTDGQPDPAKKPQPLALYGFVDQQTILEIQGRASLVPGLEVVSTGHGQDHTLCIGWDHVAVCGLLGEIEQSAKDRQRQRIQEDWGKVMETHHQLHVAAEQMIDHRAATGKPVTLTLPAARGSFALQCKAITDLCPDHPGLANLSLDISDSPANNGDTLRAAVNFGVLQGTAILSFSQEVMNWFVRYYDRTALEAAARNGRHGSMASSSDVTTGKRKANGEADGEPPNKQQKTELEGPIPEGRLFMQMRAREPIEGKICPDIQHGYLDFTGPACTRFTGKFDIPGVGEGIEVEGFRVGNEAAVEPPPWNWYWPGNQHFSEAEAALGSA